MREREKIRKRQNERVNWMFSHPNARGFHPCSFREWRSRRRFREGILVAALYPFGDVSSRKEEEALLHTTLTDERFSTSLFQ